MDDWPRKDAKGEQTMKAIFTVCALGLFGISCALEGDAISCGQALAGIAVVAPVMWWTSWRTGWFGGDIDD